MNFLRDPGLKKSFFLQLSAIAVGFAGCFFISIPAAIVLLFVSAAVLIIQFASENRRQRRISKLCDEIDKILHGAERVQFDDFREGELSVLSSEIHKMTINLREQNSALKKERRFMKEALEDISHQLRTPLTTMLLILGMMRDPGLSRKQYMEYVRELCELMSRMQWMLETLLNLSRLDAGAVTFKKESFSASELIRAAIEPLSIALELKEITLNTEIEDEPILTGDFKYLTEALVNILKNCLEHTPRNGAISIRAFENSIYTGITISDSGNGIPENDLSRIFERFFRGSEFSKNGYGLGLAFARKIVVSQNGSLRALNAKPHGAEFDLRIYKTTA